jgi:predicted DNA-binding protein (UPF0251 family)
LRKEFITLTKQEHERLAIIRLVMKRELKQKEAGSKLVMMGLVDDARPQAVSVVRPKLPKYTPPPNHPWRCYIDQLPSSSPKRP